MRASKEQADRAMENLEWLHDPPMKSNDSVKRREQLVKEEKRRLEELREFLNVAKRKLPSEAAYDKDARRRRGGK